MTYWRAALNTLARRSADPSVQMTLLAVAVAACALAVFLALRPAAPVTLDRPDAAQSAAGGRTDAAIEALRIATAAPTFAPVSADEAEAINAARPVTGEAFPAARPYALLGATPESWARAIDCLAAAIHFEAASESETGRSAVAQVVLNRLRHPAFPKTVCGVVFQGAERSTGCQFTFTCDGSLARIPSEASWRSARALAEAALSGRIVPQVGWSTNYHTGAVVPYWSSSLLKSAVIGAHIFYRIPGAYGSARAFSGRPSIEEPAIERMAGLALMTPAVDAEYGAEDMVANLAAAEDVPPLPAEFAPTPAPKPVLIAPPTRPPATALPTEQAPAAAPAEPARVPRRKGRLPM